MAFRAEADNSEGTPADRASLYDHRIDKIDSEGSILVFFLVIRFEFSLHEDTGDIKITTVISVLFSTAFGKVSFHKSSRIRFQFRYAFSLSRNI